MYMNACLCCYCVLGFGSLFSSTGSADTDDAFMDRYDCMGYWSDIKEWTSDDKMRDFSFSLCYVMKLKLPF